MPLSIPGGPLRLGGRGGLQIKSGASAAFTPSAVANLQAWYKADAITPVADGTALASWADSSTNARNLTQATGVSQPLYKTAIQNGKPVVRFDGTNDFFATSIGVLTLSQPINYFAVAIPRGGSGLRHICDGSGGGTALYIGNTTLYDIFAGTAEVGNVTAVVGTAVNISATLNGASSRISVNGSADATGNAGANTIGGTLNVGSNRTNGAFWFGDIAEVLIYGTVSTSDRASIVAYLKAKWGTP